jgi:ubiquinone/menaquinone biosynthesis C-methylase UbiE
VAPGTEEDAVGQAKRSADKRTAQAERYVIRGGEEGYERLLVQSRDRWPDTAALFDRASLSPGMRCIDLGCGGGEVTLEIGRLVASGGSVTGVDMDGTKLGPQGGSAARAGERGFPAAERLGLG